MKKVICIGALLLSSIISQAQIPGVSLVTGIIKKVIIAIDLKVQQLQNQTIALQNAEQALENKLSLGSLDDISGWLNKEKGLYQQYYQELAQVKTVIADYDEVKRIISQQKQLVTEYQNASTLFKQDKHFSASELRYIGNVYDGILNESVRNLDEVLMAVNSFAAQMSDADRLLTIHHATQAMQTNLNDLRQFNWNNARLSLARAKDEQDKQAVRNLYGLN
jgi:hypothetical protein